MIRVPKVIHPIEQRHIRRKLRIRHCAHQVRGGEIRQSAAVAGKDGIGDVGIGDADARNNVRCQSRRGRRARGRRAGCSRRAAGGGCTRGRGCARGRGGVAADVDGRCPGAQVRRVQSSQIAAAARERTRNLIVHIGRNHHARKLVRPGKEIRAVQQRHVSREICIRHRAHQVRRGQIRQAAAVAGKDRIGDVGIGDADARNNVRCQSRRGRRARGRRAGCCRRTASRGRAAGGSCARGRGGVAADVDGRCPGAQVRRVQSSQIAAAARERTRNLVIHIGRNHHARKLVRPGKEIRAVQQRHVSREIASGTVPTRFGGQIRQSAAVAGKDGVGDVGIGDADARNNVRCQSRCGRRARGRRAAGRGRAAGGSCARGRGGVAADIDGRCPGAQVRRVQSSQIAAAARERTRNLIVHIGRNHHTRKMVRPGKEIRAVQQRHVSREICIRHRAPPGSSRSDSSSRRRCRQRQNW